VDINKVYLLWYCTYSNIKKIIKQCIDIYFLIATEVLLKMSTLYFYL